MSIPPRGFVTVTNGALTAEFDIDDRIYTYSAQIIPSDRKSTPDFACYHATLQYNGLHNLAGAQRCHVQLRTMSLQMTIGEDGTKVTGFLEDLIVGPAIESAGRGSWTTD